MAGVCGGTTKVCNCPEWDQKSFSGIWLRSLGPLSQESRKETTVSSQL